MEKPANAGHLSEPDYDDAMATAGTLFHFVGGSKELRDRYARWMEHHEGDLDEQIVAWLLERCHAILEPGCPEPLDADAHPGRTR